MEEKDKLSSEFTLELFHCAFEDESVFELLREHLKYSYLVLEHEKKFWKKCIQLHTLNEKIPSLGLIQVECRKEQKVREFISDVKNSSSDKEQVIKAFQDFIKESKFVELFEDAGERYNRGEQKEAYDIFIKGAESLANFSIKDKIFTKVFGDFEERNTIRTLEDRGRYKVPFMIDELDNHTKGGPETGECVLFTAESGRGKSQALIHYAVQTARRGGRVALFQIEGTKRQVMDRLDSAWTGALYHDVKNATIERSRLKKLKSVLNKVRGEIYVEAFEKFGNATIYDIRNSLIDMKKLYGNFDLVVIDYLELLEVGDGNLYGPSSERFRQQKIGRFMKELAMEQDVVTCTATQASNLPSELKKDPNFVMTREFLSEDKGKIRPFDYHFTFNQTFDEENNKDESGEPAPLLRIYEDKMREYRGGRTISIVTNFGRARFYDRQKTIKLVLDYQDEDEE